MRVSIPFKRESGSQEEETVGLAMGAVSFNSLQTGKRIASVIHLTLHINLRSFNSLQTGKRIARKTRTSNGLLGVCFNSLQTGKRIASAFEHLLARVEE